MSGWGGLAILAAILLMRQPPVGFDLELLLAAGRRVAQGLSPYGTSEGISKIRAINLFYSYPPPVAQAFSILSNVPLNIALSGWAIGAVGGFIFVAIQLARRAVPDGGIGMVVLPVIALSPYFYPYAMALLFGNFNSWFPVLYGLALLGVLDKKGCSGITSRIAGGVAVGVAAIVKLHPASLIVWFFIRGMSRRNGKLSGPMAGTRRLPSVRDNWPAEWTILSWALGTIAGIVIFSLVTGGAELWREYLNLLRQGTAADFVNRFNVGPGSQLAMLLDNPSMAHPIAIITSVCSLVLTAWIAYYQHDDLKSFTWAAVASLVILPITWYHYPVALMPIAVAVLSRGGEKGTYTVRAVLLSAALLVGSLSIVLPAAIWVTIGMILIAAHYPSYKNSR